LAGTSGEIGAQGKVGIRKTVVTRESLNHELGVLMLDKDFPILCTFGGTFFKVTIYRSLFPPKHRLFIEVREPPEGGTNENGIFCLPAHVHELSSLSKTACELLAFLDSGGEVTEWNASCRAGWDCHRN